MKFLAALFLILSFSVGAQSLRSLADAMSDLETSYKEVSVGLQTGSITPQLITSSENVVKFVIESKSIIPNSVLSLPNIEQDAAKVKYASEMKSLEDSTTALREALKAGNLILAKQIFTKLPVLKKQGHKDFM
jgi:hypothetical protein